MRQSSVSSHRAPTDERTGTRPIPPLPSPTYTPLNHSTCAAANHYDSLDVSRSQRPTSDDYLKLYDYVDTPEDQSTGFKVAYHK